MATSPQVFHSCTHPKLRDGKWFVEVTHDPSENAPVEEKEFGTEADGNKFIRDQVAAARRKK